jgi:hypothetical protein
MNRRRRWARWVVAAAVLLIGFSIAHVLEDFVYGIPARFGLAVAPAAALLGLAYAFHVLLVAAAARESRIGYLGNLAAGLVWLVAAAADHLHDILFVSPYRAGLISKGFEVGLMLSAVFLAVTSYLAWRSRR